MAKRRKRARATKRRTKRRGKMGGNALPLAIAGGVALLLLMRRGGNDLVELDPGITGAPVQAGKSVSISAHYREIAQRRPGMRYDPVESGSIGGEIFFVPTVSGTFTRNFLNEGGQLFAEIA